MGVVGQGLGATVNVCLLQACRVGRAISLSYIPPVLPPSNEYVPSYLICICFGTIHYLYLLLFILESTRLPPFVDSSVCPSGANGILIVLIVVIGIDLCYSDALSV